MPAATAGSSRRYNGHEVLVLKADPVAGAVRIAPLSSAEPGAGEPRVQVKTWWSDHWVLLGESDVVGATDLENSWTGPDRLAGNQLDAVLREYHRTVV